MEVAEGMEVEDLEVLAEEMEVVVDWVEERQEALEETPVANWEIQLCSSCTFRVMLVRKIGVLAQKRKFPTNQLQEKIGMQHMLVPLHIVGNSRCHLYVE